jgi:integrase
VPIFSKYAADWLERKKAVHKSYSLNKGHVETALNPTFGKKALNAITVGDVNRWVGQQSVGRKPSTVLRKLAVFKKIMNDAVREGLIEKNPVSQADKIRGVEARQRIVTDEELAIILDTADEIERGQDENRERTPQQIRGWLRQFIIFAFNSGMRRAEILNLTWDRVRKIDEETTVIEVVNTKSGVSRTVSCTDGMLAAIAALRQLERAKGDNRLFPVSMTTLKRSLTRLWKKTGLGDVRLHDLRRTHATILISQNVDARTVSGRLGHSSTAMLKVYSVYRGDVEAAKVFSRSAVKTEKTEAGEETAGADDEGMAEPAQV